RPASPLRRRHPLVAPGTPADRPGTGQQHAVGHRRHRPVPRPQVIAGLRGLCVRSLPLRGLATTRTLSAADTPSRELRRTKRRTAPFLAAEPAGERRRLRDLAQPYGKSLL